MTAIATREPTPVTLNAAGKVIAGFEMASVPLPEETAAKIQIGVGYFSPRGDEPPGWRAEAWIESRGPMRYRIKQGLFVTGPWSDRSHAVLTAIEALENSLVDLGDRHAGNVRKWTKAILAAIAAWRQNFEREAKKETAMTVTAKTKILSGKECKALLEDFRRSYQCLEQSFVALGEKAATIRDQEAYGETCQTFDDWIKSEHFSRTVVYDAMKAAHFFRLTAPVAEPLKIVLDRESHFRKFPAEANAKQAKAIVRELAQLVEPEEDGSRHPTARQIEAAVAKVCPREKSAGEKGSGGERETQAEPAAAARPTLHVPETIEPEYAEVVDPEGVEPTDEIVWIEDQVRRIWNLHLGQATRQIEFRTRLAFALQQLALEIRGLDVTTWHGLSQEWPE